MSTRDPSASQCFSSLISMPSSQVSKSMAQVLLLSLCPLRPPFVRPSSAPRPPFVRPSSALRPPSERRICLGQVGPTEFV
eukprot:CAMPEP_0119479996 /NCGR_PEP_ID=MMETSP1344-20130328/9012_1 /TAXON_ID=236787 /ORGANISM="Florenciella parvula, Strain CCMP2471" /LENGTH=79 /DNA_ID=CAMNT_0007514275 /DNA_START=56 /DNA_END=291 /DNA_ORIENTATION=+